MAHQAAAAPKAKVVTIDLVAKNMAFNKSTIRAPASTQIKMTFENKDNGIPHNFALYKDKTASTSIFVGKIITGPDKAEYAFTTPSDPGDYFYRCDVHPKMMTGTFIVR